MPDGQTINAPVAKPNQKKRRPRSRTPFMLRAIGLTARITSAVAPGIAVRFLEKLFFTPRKNRTPVREKEWMQGAEVSRIPFAEGRLLPLYAWGEGPTVLLVHGFSGRGSQMGAFVTPLLAAGYRVVIFDAPAHGAADGKQTALPEVATAIKKVADHLGPLAACISHSMGAAATTIALSKGMDCARVVYIAPPEDMRAHLLKAARFIGFSHAVAERLRCRIEVKYGAAFETIRGTNLAPGQAIPALIIHDRNDSLVPFQDGKMLADSWPGARLMETEGLGHNRILQDPTVVRSALDFL